MTGKRKGSNIKVVELRGCWWKLVEHSWSSETYQGALGKASDLYHEHSKRVAA
jgi:hypothetical protein